MSDLYPAADGGAGALEPFKVEVELDVAEAVDVDDGRRDSLLTEDGPGAARCAPTPLRERGRPAFPWAHPARWAAADEKRSRPSKVLQTSARLKVEQTSSTAATGPPSVSAASDNRPLSRPDQVAARRGVDGQRLALPADAGVPPPPG